jgi:hypothetical protein
LRVHAYDTAASLFDATRDSVGLANNWGVIMPMHTPSAWTFWLSVVLVVLAIVSLFVRIPYISEYAFWVAVIGYVILVIGCTVKTK